MRKLVIGLLVLTLFLVSCVTPEKQVPEQSLPKVEEIIQNIPTHKAEVASLLEKTKDLTNYQYLFDVGTAEGYTVLINGNKMKKVYLNPVKFESDIYYNEVYFDTEQRTAFAICSKAGITCSTAWGKTYRIDFEQERPKVLPLQLLQEVPVQAEKMGEAVVDRRDAIIISYTTDGDVEHLYIDNFTGLPLQQLVFKAGDEEGIPITKHTFTDVAVGNVKTVDVTLPEGYTLAE